MHKMNITKTFWEFTYLMNQEDNQLDKGDSRQFDETTNHQPI